MIDEPDELTPDERIAQVARAAAPRYGLDPEELVQRTIAARDRRRARAALPVKNCSTCREYLPARAFAEDASASDGLQRTCKKCNAERLRARRRAEEVAG